MEEHKKRIFIRTIVYYVFIVECYHIIEIESSADSLVLILVQIFVNNLLWKLQLIKLHFIKLYFRKKLLQLLIVVIVTNYFQPNILLKEQRWLFFQYNLQKFIRIVKKSLFVVFFDELLWNTILIVGKGRHIIITIFFGEIEFILFLLYY